MGTRSGDLDAGILEYIMGKYGYDIKEMVSILNKKSGVQGVSGVSSDFRDLENAHKEGNERAGLAVDMFNYGVKKYIGAYAAAMGGVDAIIFTAGVGENSASQRLAIASDLEFMGVKMDAEANSVRGKETVISAADSKVKVLLIPTNEELLVPLGAPPPPQRGRGAGIQKHPPPPPPRPVLVPPRPPSRRPAAGGEGGPQGREGDAKRISIFTDRTSCSPSEEASSRATGCCQLSMMREAMASSSSFWIRRRRLRAP